MALEQTLKLTAFDPWANGGTIGIFRDGLGQ